MRIEPQTSKLPTLQQTRRQEDLRVQSVFKEVLMEAGRTGYASAEITETQEPLETRIEESWNSWFQTERQGRYASSEVPAGLGEAFGDVLAKAYESGAYVDPKPFLQSLTKEELKTVQNAHWLAEPIGVDSLSEEGALNLLLPPAAQVDLNGDGLTRSGKAWGIRFPDSTTPPDVRLAWEKATDGMPVEQLMTYELEMKLPVLLANFVLNDEGQFLYARQPGDPDFVNPMAAEDYSFVQVAQDWLEHLEYFKHQIGSERYSRDTEFWKSFQENLNLAAAEQTQPSDAPKVAA